MLALVSHPNYRKLGILSHASLEIHFTANTSKFLYDIYL